MARPHISTAERRARLGVRHHLAPGFRAATPEQVASSLVALHGTDPASVYLAAAARLRQPSIAELDRALYDDRTLVRMLGMRRTVYAVPRELAPVVQEACTRAIAAQERRRTVQFLRESLTDRAAISGDVSEWLAAVEAKTAAAVARLGQATAQELAKHVPELRTQFHVAPHKSYTAPQSIATRVLSQLAADGRIVRARPRGSWISSQFRWSAIESWFPDGLPAWSTPAAQVELIARWLRAYGPGTLADVKWWTGLTMGEVKRALDQLPMIDVALDGGEGIALADDVGSTPAADAWVGLLPALDPTPMGYTDRAWLLGPHGPALFDRSGNIGPTIWADGRIVGGWAQRKNGTIACKLLEDVGSAAEAEVRRAAEQLSDWLGATRITPRFRTPLERELST